MPILGTPESGEMSPMGTDNGWLPSCAPIPLPPGMKRKLIDSRIEAGLGGNTF